MEIKTNLTQPVGPSVTKPAGAQGYSHRDLVQIHVVSQSGKSEAQVLSGRDHLWPGDKSKGIRTSTQGGHGHSESILSHLRQRGGESLRTPLEASRTLRLTLKESRWLRSHTSPLSSDKCSTF